MTTALSPSTPPQRPPLPPSAPSSTPDDPDHLRVCAAVARDRARALLAARGMDVADAARAAAAYDPNPTRSRDCRLSVLAACLSPARWYKPPPRSIGWTLIARVLCVRLDTLCADPVWVAEQEAHANRPASPRPSYSNRLSALRPAARAARRALRDIMHARCMSRADMARAMSALSPISTGGPYDILGPDPSVISRYWPIAARALGIPLSALCDDPAWLAAQPQVDA